MKHEKLSFISGALVLGIAVLAFVLSSCQGDAARAEEDNPATINIVHCYDANGEETFSARGRRWRFSIQPNAIDVFIDDQGLDRMYIATEGFCILEEVRE